MRQRGPSLTAEDDDRIAQIARRHDVSEDAVLALVRALERGGGEQAQFSHPDLGGMGQWSSRGMIMIGDMFNTALKARVDALCTDLSVLVREGAFAELGTRGGAAQEGGAWWPSDCGTPSSSGSQNDMRYAYFPEARRLAIERDGRVALYDTGDHRIGGVSQQQGGGHDLSFTSQLGTIRLHDLAPADSQKAASVSRSVSEVRGILPEHTTGAGSSGSTSADDVFGKIERLHDLHRKGIVDDMEFAEKKRELLARI